MRLTDFLSNKTQIEDSNKTLIQSPNNSLVNRQIHSLAPGQTLQGEVIARNGSEVHIKVAEDMIIRARVEQNMKLEIGKMMTFEVKNNGQTLTLSPLFSNMATDANVLKALDMASLPVNDTTISMTEQLMQAGLSIDKNSLQQVFRETNLYSQSKVSDIVELHKLALPVNEENLAQVASYKNLTHQLVKGLNEVLELVPKTATQMVGQGNVEGAARLYQELLQMLTGTVEEDAKQVFGAANNQNLETQPQNALEGLEKQVIVEDTAQNDKASGKLSSAAGVLPSAADTLLKLLGEREESTAAGRLQDTNTLMQGTPEALVKELTMLLKTSAQPSLYGEWNAQLQQLMQKDTTNISQTQLAELINKLF